MATLATARFAEILGTRRIDSEYFRPCYRTLSSRLDKLHTETTPVLCLVSDGNHASVSRHFSSDPSIGPRYLRGQDIGGFFLGDTNPVYVPWSIFNSLGRSHILPGDVLLSIVGTIGMLSLVPKDAPALTGSCKIAILRPRQERISPEYLAVFLASSYGQFQIHRQTRGAVQMGLILEDMRFIRVPRFGAAEVVVCHEVEKAYAALVQAKSYYASAQQILKDELATNDVDLSHDLGYETQLAEISQTRRKYKRVLETILKAKTIKVERFVPVGRLLSYITNGHTPLYHDLTVGDVLFLTAEHVSDFRLDFGTDKRILHLHHHTELARTALREGDILVTIKGKVGNCAVVRNCPSAANINQDVALIRLRNGIHPYFFAAWFNSQMGKQLVEQRSTGGINPFLGLGNLRGMPFPVIDHKEQHRIGVLVQETVEKAHSAEQEAANLLESAKRRVEELIEQGAESHGSG
jgi:type I restriction enzyme S subunit